MGSVNIKQFVTEMIFFWSLPYETLIRSKLVCGEKGMEAILTVNWTQYYINDISLFMDQEAYLKPFHWSD